MPDLRTIRTDLGLNQTEMAARLGISQSYYSRLESGASPIDKRTQLAIAALHANAKKPIPAVESLNNGADESPIAKTA